MPLRILGGTESDVKKDIYCLCKKSLRSAVFKNSKNDELGNRKRCGHETQVSFFEDILWFLEVKFMGKNFTVFVRIFADS